MKLNIKLRLISNLKKTRTTFFINLTTLGIEDVIVYLTENGEGFVHEFIELTLLEAVLNTENTVMDYEWNYAKSLFHEITNFFLETSH